MARITLNGFYQYDDSLFDVTFPDGIDRGVVIDELLYQLGDLYPYIQSFENLKKMISNWASEEYSNLYRMLLALEAEYNPIENYDRKENWTDKDSGEDSRLITSNGTEHPNTSVITNDETSEEPNQTETTTVSAYNSAAYQPKDKVETKGTNVTRRNATETTSGTNGYDNTERDTFTYGKHSEHDGRMHGNIGVTTNQQMINEELNLRKFNIYNYIVDRFSERFIVEIY